MRRCPTSEHQWHLYLHIITAMQLNLMFSVGLLIMCILKHNQCFFKASHILSNSRGQLHFCGQSISRHALLMMICAATLRRWNNHITHKHSNNNTNTQKGGTQQTRNIDPKLILYWATVYDCQFFEFIGLVRDVDISWPTLQTSHAADVP